MFRFERFEAWKRAIAFANEMYLVSDAFPKSYQWSLGEQLRRASLSIPTNIAEGSGRDNPNERAYFYRIAKGSLYECVSLLAMAKIRNAVNPHDYTNIQNFMTRRTKLQPFSPPQLVLFTSNKLPLLPCNKHLASKSRYL